MPANDMQHDSPAGLPAEVLTASANLTDLQVAKLLNCSASAIRNARSLRKGPLKDLPYFKFGRSIRYSLRDVLEFQSKRRIDPAALYQD